MGGGTMIMIDSCKKVAVLKREEGIGSPRDRSAFAALSRGFTFEGS
jgi:hypothetical protein